MADLNRVFLMGNLTRDPELRYTPSGMAVCNLGIAVNREFFDKQKQKQKEVTFLNVVVWGKSGEACGSYLKKGRPVFVEGRLQSRSWEGKDGQKNKTIEVVADRVQFMGGRDDAPGGGPGGGRPQQQQRGGGGGGGYDEDPGPPPPDLDGAEDDIPF